MAVFKRRLIAALFLLVGTSVRGEEVGRVWFSDTDGYVIEQNYDAHNIFIVNGTTVTLESGNIKAPDSSDNGEDAVRVEDASFHAKKGIISGGLGVGGTGVTISTTRDSEYPAGTATFEAGVEVYGGDATRGKTTKGGDAIQVLQAGSSVTINGGKFVPGMGCTMKACGTVTDDGVALQVIMGEAIVKGGAFEGVFFNLQGDIELHGSCVEYDQESETITGRLLDGSEINVSYMQPKGQNRPPKTINSSEDCGLPPSQPQPTTESGGGGLGINRVALMGASVVMGIAIGLQ